VEFMAVILGVIAIAFLVFLVVGAITGRVTVTPCSAVAEPHDDERSRAALGHDVQPPNRE